MTEQSKQQADKQEQVRQRQEVWDKDDEDVLWS